MYEPDYEGSMSYYQDQLLKKKGITKAMLDMDRYIGLTARELQSIVDSAYLKRKPICNCKKCNASIMSPAASCPNCGTELEIQVEEVS